MEPNRSKRDMGRYQQGRGGQPRTDTRYPAREECGCSSSHEKLDQYPLAMAYVPWQKFGRTYELEKGFRMGTIFPELDMPFMRVRCRER